MKFFNKDGQNLALLPTETKPVRKGRPFLLHENLDYAETRYVEFTKNDTKMFFSGTRTNIEKKAKKTKKAALLAKTTIEDIEEKAAFKSISLVLDHWMKTQ